MSTYRYPGVKPFETSDRHIFFGRDQDIADLYDLLVLEKLVVLFGKSGYGKSSILNAGILPKFQNALPDSDVHYQPITVRFNLYVDDKSIPPLEQVRRRLAEEAEENPEGIFLANDTLWQQFKRRQSDRVRHFLLVFDQFEEFFSYPKPQQDQFKEELAELVYKTMPQAVRDALDDYTAEQRSYLSRKLDVKAVFAIRSDRMSDLDSLKDKLPAILYKRYELKGLSPEQARQAIITPAALPQQDNNFISSPFHYTEGALDKIVQELSAPSLSGEGQGGVATAASNVRSGIEAFQLQILCQYIESEVIAGRIRDRDKDGKPDVDADDLPNIANVYEAYYRSQLDKLNSTEREAARELIEYGLLYEDPQKGEARRVSVDADLLVQKYAEKGATQALLKKLENTFLLRREMNTLGGYNYELSHDSLIKPVFKAKTERKAEKERRNAERRAQEAEAKAREERRRSRRATILAVVGFLLAAVAIGAGIFAGIALRKLQVTASQTVILLLRETDQNIKQLNYAFARDKCQAAIELGQQRPEVVKRIQEIAFFYTESGQLSKADSALQLLQSQSTPLDRTSLLATIENLNTTYYDTLEKRYYPEMVTIEGGTFTMGSEDGLENEKPPHLVKLSTYKIAKTETTVWQYKLFAVAIGDTLRALCSGLWGDNPIVNVSWYDAIAYANWVSERKGLQAVYAGDLTSENVQANWQANGYRLPTEAEWEFAARGGNVEKDKNYTYAGGNDLDEVGWYDQNSPRRTQPVAQKKPNALGLYDLSGNAWERCWDWYSPLNPPKWDLPTVPAQNPRGAKSGASRVARGGAWYLNVVSCRVSVRSGFVSDGWIDFVGFRLAGY